MPSPSVSEAIRAKWIIVGQFMGYQKKPSSKVDYFNGVIASYEVVQLLKNTTLPKRIKIHYEFNDGSSCVASEGWKFNKNTMPKIGSKWILFLNKRSNGELFTTYRGDFGRLKATEENIATVQSYGVSTSLNVGIVVVKKGF